MALNASKVKGSGNSSDRVQQANLTPGAKAARLVQVVDLGIQPQRPYMGEEKPPVQTVYVTYELSHDFMKDEKGNDVEDKPRWMSEDFPFYSLEADRAKSTKRYMALDPAKDHGGDWTELLGNPCQVVIVNNAGKGKNAGRIFDNIADVTPAVSMPGYVQPELSNKGRFFSLEEPDMDIFNALPEWLRDRVTSNLEFAGSKLEAAIGGGTKAAAPAPEPAPAEDEDDSDSPY